MNVLTFAHTHKLGIANSSNSIFLPSRLNIRTLRSIHVWISRDVGNSGEANMQIFELPSEHVGAGTSIESREVILKKTYW